MDVLGGGSEECRGCKSSKGGVGARGVQEGIPKFRVKVTF